MFSHDFDICIVLLCLPRVSLYIHQSKLFKSFQWQHITPVSNWKHTGLLLISRSSVSESSTVFTDLALFLKITMATTSTIPVARHDETLWVYPQREQSSVSLGLAWHEVSVVVHCSFDCPNFNCLDWGLLRITEVTSLDICLAFDVDYLWSLAILSGFCNVKPNPMFVRLSHILCDLRRLLFDHEPFLHFWHNYNPEQVISTL